MRYRACGKTPRVLPGEFLSSGIILELDLEHFGEVLAKAMRCSSLNTSAILRNEGFAGGGVKASCEFLSLRLLAQNNRYCHDFLINSSIEF